MATDGNQLARAVVKTPWQALQEGVTHLPLHASDKNSGASYLGPSVNLNTVEVWHDFMANGEIANMLNDPELKPVLFRPFTAKELDEFTWGVPHGAENQTFEQLWAGIQQLLNVVLRMCASSIQHTANPTLVIMGEGVAATQQAHQLVGLTRFPDFAGYEYISGSGEYDPKYINNRLPGDAKSAMKIKRSMLPPDGHDF